MTPDPLRERDLADKKVAATVRSDGARAVVELSIDDLDRLVASSGISSGMRVVSELCNECWTSDASLCRSCAVSVSFA